MASSATSTGAVESEPAACGLANLGNSCYLNALLQCLASLPQFRDDLVASDVARARSYTGSLRECLWEIRRGQSETVQANRALWRQLQRGGLIDGTLADDLGAQQDAEEMLGALCEAMATEREAARRVALAKDDGRAGDSNGGAGLAAVLTGPAVPTAATPAAPAAPAASPAAVERLRGMFASGYTCTVCGWKSDVAVTPSWNIPLAWPDTKKAGEPVRLLDLFGHFATAELIEGVYCPGCSGTAGLNAAERAVAEGPECTHGAQGAVQMGRGGRAADTEWRARAESGRERLLRWRQHVGSGDPLTPMPWPPWPTAPPPPPPSSVGDARWMTGVHPSGAAELAAAAQRGGGGGSLSNAAGNGAGAGTESEQPPEPRQRVEVKKWISLCRLPDCLCLALKRLQYDRRTGQQYKDTRPVQYPLRLDLRPFVSLGEVATQNRLRQADLAGGGDGDGGVYELCGVVMHHGGAHGGHYTSYVRLAGASGRHAWAHADDERVQYDVPEEIVVAGSTLSRAYMLFYSKEHTRR
jgi:hypothetical protein